MIEAQGNSDVIENTLMLPKPVVVITSPGTVILQSMTPSCWAGDGPGSRQGKEDAVDLSAGIRLRAGPGIK